MTIVALVLFAVAIWVGSQAIVAIASAWRGGPAFDRTLDEDAALRDVRELLSRKTMLVQLIRSTELDQDMGRIDAGDAARLVNRYQREAVRVMRDLDALQGQPEDIERATALFEERSQRAAERIEAGENAWSSVAARRHATMKPSEEAAP